MLEDLDWVTALRSDAVTPIFIVITQAGSVYFLVPFLSVLYWLWDKDIVLRVAVLTVTSLILNKALKYGIALPRPDDVPHLISVSGWGMPSGHAQTAIVVWGWFAIFAERRSLKTVAVVFILLISFSRMYLGVHSPLQVLTGGMIGGSILLVGYLIFRFLAPLWGHWREASKASILSLWILAAAISVPDVVQPGGNTSIRTLCVTAAVVLVGLWWGSVIERRNINFQRRSGLGAGFATAGLGTAIFSVIFVGCLFVLDSYGDAFPYLVFAVAFALGITSTLFVPAVLDRVGLGRR